VKPVAVAVVFNYRLFAASGSCAKNVDGRCEGSLGDVVAGPVFACRLNIGPTASTRPTAADPIRGVAGGGRAAEWREAIDPMMTGPSPPLITAIQPVPTSWPNVTVWEIAYFVKRDPSVSRVQSSARCVRSPLKNYF